MILYIRSFIIFFVTVQEHGPKPSEARSVFCIEDNFLLKKYTFCSADSGATLFKTDLASEGFSLCSWTVIKKKKSANVENHIAVRLPVTLFFGIMLRLWS